jgi:murein DD-endopeptidase MepM/ murein hydrolase activator NlpD
MVDYVGAAHQFRRNVMEKQPLRTLLIIVLSIAIPLTTLLAVLIVLPTLKIHIPESKLVDKSSSTLICRNKPMTEAELRPFLKNKFKGQEHAFVRAASDHRIDITLLVAIAQHETGYGTSEAVHRFNNPGGLMGDGAIRRYPTLEAGIQVMAENLYKRYISQNLLTIPQIAKKYAPVGAKNDPTQLNQYWVPTVTAIVNKMGGITSNCAATGGIIELEQSDYGFQLPLKSGKTLREFGWRNDVGKRHFHRGLDWNQAPNAPILAAQSGTVEIAQFGKLNSGWSGYGNVIVINHHNGYWTLYGHLAKLNVKVGDRVQRGQVIGQQGNTGTKDGSHLHFEVKTSRLGGQVDPRQYLPF